METGNATDRSSSENVAAAFVLVILTLVACVGNGLVILSFFVCQNLRAQPGNSFVMNLALTDLLCAVYVQIPCIVNLVNVECHFNGTACTVHSVFTWTIMTSSNWTLAAISIDRAIAINKPFQHRTWVTNLRVRVTIACIWIFSLIVSCTLTEGESFNAYELMCSPTFSPEDRIKGHMVAVFCFWIPTLTLLFSNISIIYVVRHSKSVVMDRCPEATEQENPKFCVKDYSKTLRSLYVLVIVYFFCVIPYYTSKFSFITKENGLLPNSMVILTILLVFLASALNPFIYALLRQDHKNAFIKTINMIYAKINSIKIYIFGESKALT